MHILVSNDAPKDNKSGCGMGLSLRREVSVERVNDASFVVDGTPADCVYIGLIALSINERNVKHYETAAYIAVQMSNALPLLNYRSLLSVLNVNLADIPVADLRGFKATVSGQREAPLSPKEVASSLSSGLDNVSSYVLGPAGDFKRSKRSKMQDFEAVEQGYASITPFNATLDDSAYVDDVQAWLDTL